MKEFAEKLVEINAIKLTTPDQLFTWVSGIKSPIYCDNRLIISYPDTRKIVALGLASHIRKTFPEAEIIAGTATAGIPHATLVADLLHLPMVYVRSSSKDHGTQKLIEGKIHHGAKTVLIEDLISTGKSSIAAIGELHDAGAEVIACCAIFSYEFEESEEAFKMRNIPLFTLTNYREVLEYATETGVIDEKNLALLSEWSKNPRMFTDER